jgi:glycosyltransferase involved in cell wall biosynthesis
MTARVGVNLLWLVPGDVGGSESWATGVLGAVADDAPADLTVVVFATAAVLDAYPRLGDAFEVVRVPAPIGPSRALRVAAESSWLAGAARRAAIDVLHHPGGTIPVVRATPSIVTIHDLQPLTLPEHFSRAKRSYLRARLGPSVRRARVVTAVSAFTAADVVDRLDADPGRVMLTPPAVDPDPAPPAIEAEAVAAAYRLTPRWFVYPAITYPHKNHAVLLHALAELRHTHDDVSLVLTGGAGSEEGRLHSLAERLGVADRVRRPGRVPADHLDRLYRGAVACAFPSTYEAVGLPVLEAMARSCPVIASNAAGLVDAVGDAADILDPDDPAAWAAAMGRLLDDDQHRAALVATGRRRIPAWAPAVSGARLVDAWRRGAAR